MMKEGLSKDQAELLLKVAGRNDGNLEMVIEGLASKGVNSSTIRALKGAVEKGGKAFAKTVKSLQFSRLDKGVAKILEEQFTGLLSVQKGFWKSAKLFDKYPLARKFYEQMVLSWQLEAAAMFASDFITRTVVDKDAASFFKQDLYALIKHSYLMLPFSRVYS